MYNMRVSEREREKACAQTLATPWAARPGRLASGTCQRLVERPTARAGSVAMAARCHCCARTRGGRGHAGHATHPARGGHLVEGWACTGRRASSGDTQSVHQECRRRNARLKQEEVTNNQGGVCAETQAGQRPLAREEVPQTQSTQPRRLDPKWMRHGAHETFRDNVPRQLSFRLPVAQVGRNRPEPAEIGPVLAMFGRIDGSKSSDIGSLLVHISGHRFFCPHKRRPSLAEFRAKLGRSRAEACRIRPNSAQKRSSTTLKLGRFQPNWLMCGLSFIWSNLAQSRPRSAQFGPASTKVGDVDRC